MNTPSIIVYRNPIEQMFWESEYTPKVFGVLILFMVILIASVHMWDWILVKTNRKFISKSWLSYVPIWFSGLSYVPIWFSVLATYLLIRFVF